MAKTATVVDMGGKSVEPSAKKERERICMIETMPKPEWFVKTTNGRGRTVWYLRIEITGLLPRRYGPFKSRHTALLFLDDALDNFGDTIAEVEDAACKRLLKGCFQKRWGWVIEDELGQAYRKPNRKKPGAA